MGRSEITTTTSQSALPVLAPRPVLEPDTWRPPTLTAAFALGWGLTLVILGVVSVVVALGLIATLLLFLSGDLSVSPVAAFSVTAVLLGRGWVGMVQTIRGRLRPRDLDDPEALPSTFWSLSVDLQKLVRHGRSVEIVVREPDLSLAELDRELFEWLTSMAALPAEDRRFLFERGLEPARLREELVYSRDTEDRQRGPLRTLMARRARRGRIARSHRERVVSLLQRFDREVLRMGDDPFRGGRPRAVPEGR